MIKVKCCDGRFYWIAVSHIIFVRPNAEDTDIETTTGCVTIEENHLMFLERLRGDGHFNP